MPKSKSPEPRKKRANLNDDELETALFLKGKKYTQKESAILIKCDRSTISRAIEKQKNKVIIKNLTDTLKEQNIGNEMLKAENEALREQVLVSNNKPNSSKTSSKRKNSYSS